MTHRRINIYLICIVSWGTFFSCFCPQIKRKAHHCLVTGPGFDVRSLPPLRAWGPGIHWLPASQHWLPLCVKISCRNMKHQLGADQLENHVNLRQEQAPTKVWSYNIPGTLLLILKNNSTVIKIIYQNKQFTMKITWIFLLKTEYINAYIFNSYYLVLVPLKYQSKMSTLANIL